MLNPALYQALTKLFPSGVRIVNEGEPLVFGARLCTNGKLKKWKEQSGEQYQVCCPVCGDQRFRLYISYAWGMDDVDASKYGKDISNTKQVGRKYPTSMLVVCHNERCHEHFDPNKPASGNVRRWLEERMRSSYLKALDSGKVSVQPVVKDRGVVEKRVPFPKAEWVQPVSELPADHPAAQYIRERGFDPVVLYNEWGVVYANQYPVTANGKDYSWLAGRIFIPTPQGWQARALTTETKVKYFSCPGWKKSEVLYNQQRASEYPFAILCEGVTDVWRVGAPGVCIFGKTLSNDQSMKLKKNWDTVGVLLDPDTETDSVNSLRRAMNQLAGLGLKVFRITLAGQKDAAECSHEFLWNCIERDAAKCNYTEVRRP